MFHTRFNPPRPKGLDGFEPSRTQQHLAADTDINNIMERATRGIAPNVVQSEGMFSDFSQVGSYQELNEILLDAQSQFMALPANIRSRFRNDPGQLIDFLNDPNNKPEAINLGLIPEPQAPNVGEPVTNKPA